MTEKLSNPSLSCVNSDLTQNPPTCSIAPIHADEVTMNADSRNKRSRFDSYPLRHFKCGARNAEFGIQMRPRVRWFFSYSALRTCRKGVIRVSRDKILKLTSLSSCAG